MSIAGSYLRAVNTWMSCIRREGGKCAIYLRRREGAVVGSSLYKFSVRKIDGGSPRVNSNTAPVHPSLWPRMRP